jgi:hypothetical protein
MTRQYLLPRDGRVFKANLHSHSTCSDGVMSPEELKALYTSQGYSILAYTDHCTYRVHGDLADDTFLPIAGYELNFDEFDSNGRLKKTCHINAIALDPAHAAPIDGSGVYTLDVVNEAVRRLRRNGFIVNLNHPAWSNLSPEEVLNFEGLTAMELYNSGCSRTYNSGENQLHYEAWLKAGKRCMALFTDDNHASCNAFSPKYAGSYHPNYRLLPPESVSRVPSMDCCRGHVMIHAPELSYPAVMDSLVNGRYYCSTGPVLTAYYMEDSNLCIECSPVRAIFMKTRTWGISSSFMDPNGRITKAQFDLRRLQENDEGYFRLELIDLNGEMAYTNPWYL